MTAALLEKDKNPIPAAEDGVDRYLREIQAYPLLTPEEERELARRCAAGDEEAVRRMVNANLRLVVAVARKYTGRGVPLLDLVQEGSIGLLVAARKFDYTLDYRFSTYATKWIRQGVTRCLMEHAGLIRVPAHTAERMRKIITAQRELYQQLGRAPSSAEVSAACGISEAKVRQLLELIPEIGSLDAPVGDETDGTLIQLLKELQAPQPYEELVQRELKETMDDLLARLEPRQRQVLRLYYGMEDGVCRSFEEIGKTMGVSKERARQIKRQAMDKLQRLGEGLGLEDYLE